MRDFSLCLKWCSYIGCNKYWQRIKTSKLFLLCLEIIKLIWDFAPKLLVLLYQLIIELLKPLWILLQKNKRIKTYSDLVKIKILNYYQKSETVLFIKEFIKSPSTIGAVYPSSKRLAQCMAKEVIVNKNDIVIELGAGTGNVTEALLKKGLLSKQLVVIERSPELATILRAKFPSVNVIQGDAANLLDLLSEYNPNHIRYVVSSLPFRSLLPATTNLIIQQITQLMCDHTKLIQFTYSLGSKQPNYFAALNLFNSLIVWPNLPPARINVFNRH